MAPSSALAPDTLRRQLCNAFCGAVNVHPVPTGFAISSAFEDSSGDRISFYLTEAPDGFQIEDDGSYLAELIARGIPVDQGTRGQMLDAILAQAGAYWDRETLEIKSSSISEKDISKRVISFLSSLIRVRDLELLTRENVRSTFREDAIAEISRLFGESVSLFEDKPVFPDLSEFPADLVMRPRVPSGLPGAIYFVNNNDKLNEALLLKMEAQNTGRDDFAVIALIEEPDMKLISRKRFQRAQNRSLSMPIFRGDEAAAMAMISRQLKISLPPQLNA